MLNSVVGYLFYGLILLILWSYSIYSMVLFYLFYGSILRENIDKFDVNFSVWDQTKACRFNWLWHDTTTFDNYTEETSYENSILVQQTGALLLSSLSHVMRSLTPNARGIFLLLAKYQLENKDNATYLGVI